MICSGVEFIILKIKVCVCEEICTWDCIFLSADDLVSMDSNFHSWKNEERKRRAEAEIGNEVSASVLKNIVSFSSVIDRQEGLVVMAAQK